MKSITVFTIIITLCGLMAMAYWNAYGKYDIPMSLKYERVKDIPPPTGFSRQVVVDNSFAAFLRNIPLKQDNNAVYLYNGELKGNQDAQFSVIKMEVGKKDLQQCADAVMRLRAEYLYAQERYDDIHFNYVSDSKPRYFETEMKGDHSRAAFEKYLETTFNYANTLSLKNELKPVTLDKMQIGDVFIKSGNPYGHAMIVIDMAVNTANGKKMFMLAQSYMPAQEIHIVKNPTDSEISPWYPSDFVGWIITPEYLMTDNDLRRFKD
ncbi:MAG: DUF4846 domain-containing protein [Chitinophagales bacterium]|nr:DUF4846 domain-containing protein [Chitinophagales bacterium]